MRVLVTGDTGFVGRHAVKALAQAGHDVIPFHIDGRPGDLRIVGEVDSRVASARPEACLHLGGIAFVPACWEDPALAMNVNVVGTMNLLESFRRHAPSARIVFVSTAQVYGNSSDATPLDEDAPLRPENAYAVSKMAADVQCLLHARRYGMPVMTARPSNHIGPGQSPDFVVSSFVRQVVAIRSGKTAPVMRVGNLESERDFLDVRDIVRGYEALLQSGTGGRAYNLASNRFVSIRWMLDTLCSLAGVSPSIEIDPTLFRPTDTQPRLSTHRITSETGWKPSIPLEQTLRDLLDEAMSDSTAAKR